MVNLGDAGVRAARLASPAMGEGLRGTPSLRRQRFSPRESEIVRLIARQPRRMAGYKQLLHDLGLHGNQRRELAERLRSLVKRGELLEIGHDRFSIPAAASQKGLVAGRLSMHRDGFGFVTPEDEALRNRISGDIYIPASAVGTAMHRDRVLVEMGRMRPKDLIGKGLSEASWAGGGMFGAFARIAGSVLVAVKSVVPSKFRESSTMFRYASSVTSATDARITDLPGLPNSVCMKPEV